MLRNHTIAIITVTAASLVAGGVLASDGHHATGKGDRVEATAPTATVRVSPQRTRVDIVAPYTDVQVDTVQRSVRIRVPYFSGDIRW